MLVPGPSRCSNQPLPWRESACATTACAWVIFGKWPTRIFDSPKQQAAATNHSEIDKRPLEIFMDGVDLVAGSAHRSSAETTKQWFIAAVGPLARRCRNRSDTDILRARHQ